MNYMRHRSTDTNLMSPIRIPPLPAILRRSLAFAKKQSTQGHICANGHWSRDTRDRPTVLQLGYSTGYVDLHLLRIISLLILNLTETPNLARSVVR